MKYWDSSALIPLIVEEPGSRLTRGWLREDGEVVTWALSRLELTAAVERRVRAGAIAIDRRRAVLDRFEALWGAWSEVSDLLAVRARAAALLARHPLRAADSAQLAAALLAAEDDPSSVPMVCLDRTLAEAAAREGMNVLTWPEPKESR